ncbi:MAG: helix-turn-helix transcriptional regulator [Eggerthellaceae bacterium]
MGIADDEKIRRMQDCLPVIRSVAQWTAERLGEEIGVSRQTINNLENGKTKMTKTQYLALRSVFNHEAMVSENVGLAQIIQTYVDYPVEDIEPNDKEETQISNAMDGLSAATNVLADRKVASAISAAVGAAAPALAGLLTASVFKKGN